LKALGDTVLVQGKSGQSRPPGWSRRRAQREAFSESGSGRGRGGRRRDSSHSF